MDMCASRRGACFAGIALTLCILVLAVPTVRSQTNNVRYTYPEHIPQGAASLAFVFDITGSMYDDLVQVIEGAAKILATTLARREKPLHNYVLVPFHDPEIGPITSTTDPQLFQRELRDLYVQGGGDCPEMSVGAIQMALEECLPNSFIYVFTDARAKDYSLVEQVLTLIQQKQSQVVFVMTGDCGNTSHPGYKAYEQIASTSSGQVFLLKKSQVNQVLNFVRVAVQSRKVNLLTVDIDTADSRQYDIPVDGKLQEFTVSVSGSRPRITLRDPDGNRVNRRNGLNELLSLKKALIVNVKDPKPGIWKLQVTSDGPHTVRITGLSGLDFIHGFSRIPTLTFTQTENRPIKGVATHLLINATGLEYPGRLTKVELVNLRGEALVDIPIVYNSQHITLYNTSAFMPPDEFFFMRVHGIDQEGYDLTRATPTAISPRAPAEPIVNIPAVSKGYYNKVAVLTCSVISPVPYTVQWYREYDPLGTEQFFSDSANVTWSIPDASSYSEGYYRCNATNAAGTEIGETYLDVKDPPPVINTPQNASALPGNDALLTCVAHSTVEYNMTWYNKNTSAELIDNPRAVVYPNGSVLIRHVEKADEGPYVCRAANEGGFTEETVHLLVQKAPVVRTVPEELHFTSGQTVSIRCASVAYPEPYYSWQRDGQAMQESDRVDIDDRGELVLRHLDQQDAGEYTCIATNVAGTGRAIVTLHYNEAPRISVPNPRLLVNSGDTARLRCLTQGIPPPRIRWFRGDTEYADMSFIQVTDEGELLILGTQDMDAGEYKCVATNQAGQTSATITLEVGSAPVITKSPMSVGVEILTNATLPCAATGIPEPMITWSRADGAPMNFQARFNAARDGSLKIAAVQKSDEGMYICTAQNEFGTAQASAFVSVTGIVRPLLAYTSPRVDTITGRTIRLQCLVLLGNPRPSVTWIKMGERVQTGGRVEDSGNGNLLIRDVQLEDEGEYTCVASNVGGNATHVTTLDVQVPPSIVDEGDSEFTAIQDHSVRLPCEVSGDPRPQITWTKNGVRIAESDPHYFISESGSLEIFSADPQDTATYSCTAINVAGVQEKRLTLFVQIPPHISRDQHLYTVIVSNPVQMPCEAQGIPQPETTWYKSGERLDPENPDEGFMFLPNGALRINGVRVQDGGIYECIATSPAGNDTKAIQLRVQVPPQITSTDSTEQQVIVGEPVTLGCEASGDPPPSVRWRKDLRELNFYDPTTRYLLSDTGSLVLLEAEVADTGRFLCVVENPAGVVTREINLLVYEPPVISAGIPSNTSIVEGQRLLLACPATGTPAPQIEWRKDGVVVTGNEIGMRLLSDGSLQLDAAQSEDAGKYKCVASNLAGNISHVVTLSVYLPPRFVEEEGSGEVFSIHPESASILANQSIRLSCPVDAVPPPQITWFQDGRPLRPDDLSSSLAIWRGGRELEVRKARVEDSATYTCVARNLAGETEKIYHLKVHVRPKFDLSTPYQVNISVIVSRPVFIDCPAFGVPSPEIVWFKDGYEIYPEGDSNIRLSSEGRRLEIINSEVGDHGDYQCVAKNPAGYIERDFTLSVLVPPRIDESTVISSPEVVVNKSIVLHCPASGIPVPTVSWYRDEVALTNTSRYTILDDGWRLQIQPAQREDVARYACRAINTAGNAEKYFDLQVLVPPRISEGNIERSPKVTVNRSIVLNCPVSGVPSPDLSWQRNGEPIDTTRYPSLQVLSEGRQLRVSNAQVGDTANYRCLASNKAGLAKVDYTLEVQVPVEIDKEDLVFDPKVIEKNSVILDCPAVGIPIPVLKWYKDGAEVNLTTSEHYRILQDGQQLEILKVHVDDAGHFECRASNEAGSDIVFYDLEVYVSPVIDDETSTSINPEVIVNQTIVINCFVTGLPRPEVEWLVNGRPLDIETKDGRLRYLSEGQQLEISNAELGDTARYTCVASNEAGVADRDFDLDVLVPPYIDTTNIETSQLIVKGRSVLLNCPAMGTPFPTVEWLKERAPVEESGRLRLLGNGRQLEISFTQESDTARYTCVATNVAGATHQDYDLHILVPPSIDEANIVDSPRVVVNRTVLLECPVSGIPPPDVTWLKNSVPVSDSVPGLALLSDGRQLQIARAQVTHTARYTCIASNEAGELQRNFDLEVLVPPSLDGPESATEVGTVENRTVYLDCSVGGVPPPSIMWMKDRQPLLDFPYPRLRLLRDGHQLEIREAKLEDGGRYSCMATNVAGQLEKDFKLKVMVPARIAGGHQTEEVAVTVRQSVRIECRPYGSPEPNVTWFKDGEPLELAEARHIRVLQAGRILQILGATVNDAAGYTCSARNEAGQDQKLFRLEVHVPPSINDSRRLTEMSVVIGQPLYIECIATGFPPPTITWLREGQLLSYLGNPNLRLLEDGSRLQIINAQLLDIGQYSCMASNVAGNVTKDFLVTVQVPPTIEEGPTAVGATVNTRTLLMCETLGLPDPEITWEKDGEVIPNNGLRYRMHRSGSLEFSAVSVEDSGSYTCTAHNDAGSVSRTITLAVQVPPVIAHDGPVELKVTEDQRVALPCEATGVPPPRITWQKGSRVLTNSVGYELLSNGSLQISRVEVMDTGIYICMAQNNAGTALGQVRLVVQVPPLIEDQQTEFTVVRDREVLLPCRVSGVPTPKVTWEKDGEPIPPGDFHYRVLRTGWLAIPISMLEDSGAYMCIAENDAGRASILIDLVVQVPPVIDKTSSRIVTVTEGDVASLPCSSMGFPPPVISWIHDGRTTIHNDAKYQIVEEDGTLNIQNVDTNDGGSYVCTAVNTAGRDSTEILLRVQVPPRFTVQPRDQEVTANGRIELECAAEGIPTPTITWRVNNTALPVSQPSLNGRSRLVIDNAMKHHDGTYMCVAENPGGLRRALAAVRVKVPPRVLIPPGNQAVTLAEKILLSCAVGGDPPPTILWTKNGIPVKLNSRVQQLGNGSLVIYDSVNEDAGEYKCVATNDAGSSEGTALLTVRSPPGFEIEPVDVTVEQGQNVHMDCVAYGEPEPTLTWRKERQELHSHDRLTIMANNTLRIIASQLADSGVYICMARNNLGSVLVQAELTVQVHGAWSPWLSWSQCSVSCGSGEQYRTRACDNPEPANNGWPCAGHSKETQICSPTPCPVDGQWSEWNFWEPCSKSCGTGERSRTRECDSPPPLYGGKHCEGAALEMAVCNIKTCPIHGDWGDWGEWQACSETCGDGLQERYRRCDNPRAQHGGQVCRGSDTDTRTCRNRDCEVHGSWNSWTEWTGCTLSCGGGSRTRQRICDAPAPSHGGRYCPGSDRQIDYCNREPCPVHGNWAAWASWGDCTMTCGGGQRRRFRTCSNPPPKHDGRPCQGATQDTETCNELECAVDGSWGVWGDWSDCSKTCGSGSQQRYRACREPLFGGLSCSGDGSQIRKCNVMPCRADQPQFAIANVIGNVNNEEFGIAHLIANISRNTDGTAVEGKLIDVPASIGPYLQHLISILAPVYWTTAAEVGEAQNGYSLTEGNFRREVQVEFATGEVLKMTHIARGVDEEGVLQIDVIINGDVPMLPPKAKIRVLPYVEDYIQTGPGTIYAQSSRMFRINGYSLPYAWNHTITYDPDYGRMPFLVQRLSAEDLFVSFDISDEVLQYQVSTSVARGDPSNQCPSGFFLEQDGPYCIDDNECGRLNPCSHFCHNKPGSFSCSCPLGLSLDYDGRGCKDIDECEHRIARCHRNQECENTIGSYRCVVRCGPGFRRTAGGLACQDVDECRETPNVCDQQCLNLIGSYRCACAKGYRLQGRSRCLDINECSERSPCSHGCNNSPGSYRCTCPTGLVLRNGNSCTDIDECATGQHTCTLGQECRNKLGGFQCVNTCPVGFEPATNGSCVDVDECARGLSLCHYEQTCQNTQGGYRCICPRGYRSNGPGQPCEDINECLDEPCAHRCVNLRGSYYCTCPFGQHLLADKKSCAGLQFLDPGEVLDAGALQDGPQFESCRRGYRLVDGRCQDIDECSLRQRCQHVCQNTPGSFRCTCPQGYRISPNSRTCQDIDECQELQISCGDGQICFNRRGDYECIDTLCPENYERDARTGYCVLECSRSPEPCPPGSQFADILEFRTVALPNGIPAYQDLIRLIAYDQYGEHLPRTTFEIKENDKTVPFNIRIEDGKGVVFTLKPLEEKKSYRIKVQAKSFDHRRLDVQYQTTFIIFISVSAFPY